MLLLICALKMVEEIILYYDARLKKLQIISLLVSCECETWSLSLKIFENEVGLLVHMRRGK